MEIRVYGVIEPGFAGLVKDKLSQRAKGEPIDVWISSPGGDLNEGVTVYNMLNRLRKSVTVDIEGEAFSAASLIAMAGSEVRMAENAIMMIHEPWLPAIRPGTIENTRRVLKSLEALSRTAVRGYRAKTQLDADVIAGYMADETYFDAAAAQAHGFVDLVGSGSPVQNMALDEYPVHHKEKLAKMLAARPSCLTAEECERQFQKVMERVTNNLERINTHGRQVDTLSRSAGGVAD